MEDTVPATLFPANMGRNIYLSVSYKFLFGLHSALKIQAWPFLCLSYVSLVEDPSSHILKSKIMIYSVSVRPFKFLFITKY